MTWPGGHDRIRSLLDTGELEQVPASETAARQLLTDAGKHLASAGLAAESGDLGGAYQLAYDAFRKSALSLLAAQGLRATSKGGHIAVQDAVGAQFGRSVSAFGDFSRIRRARNKFEYPGGEIVATPDRADVADAVATAGHARDAAATILDQNMLTPWS